jgi:hypothetical protein
MRGTDTSPQPYFTVLSDFLLNQREFIAELRSRVNQFASQKEAAKAWGVWKLFSVGLTVHRSSWI